MGLSSSLNAGVMGLAVNATKLATISDNIANSETFGYKRANAIFTSMVTTEGNGSYTAGGVQVATFKDVNAQGAIITTGNSMDLSIAGGGMLPVTTEAGITGNASQLPLRLTSTGSFAPDENGYLRTLSGNFLLGWPAALDGTISVPGRDSAAGLEPVRLDNSQFAASPTTEVNFGLNIPASATQAGGAGAPFDLPVEYFDSLGRSQTLTTTFTPQVPASGASNTWDVSVFDSAGNPAVSIADFTIVFDDTATLGGSILSVTDGPGATYDAATGKVAINVAFGPVDLVIGSPGAGGPLTQLSSVFSPVNVSADGTTTGTLSKVEINADGMLEAIYDNGNRQVIYQIPLADVPNPNGLTALDNQTFALSNESGDVYFWDAGTGPVGTTLGYSLTESTTDIAAELTDLIQTQRAYSSNAKIIQTVDEMLQETTNLIR